MFNWQNRNMNITPITKVTFKTILKERIFIGSLVVYFLLICLSYFLSDLVAGDVVKVFLDFLFSFSLLITVIFAIFVSVSNTFTDFKEKVVYIIFSKPISRTDYILGKFVGICLAFFLFWAITCSMCSISILVVDKLAKLHTPHIVYSGAVLKLSLGYLLMGILLTALGIVFALIFSSLPLCIMAAFFTFVSGLELAPVRELVLRSEHASVIHKHMVNLAFYILPNFSLYDLKQAVVHCQEVVLPAVYIGKLGLYTILYSAIFLLLAIGIIKKREF